MSKSTHSLFLMGTKIDLLIEAQNSEQLIQDCIQLLQKYNHRFSANDNNSELMVINNNAGIKPICPHPDLFELIALGKKHSLSQPSHLNIAIGPLVKSWHIGFEDARLPSDTEIKQQLSLTDPHFIQIDKKNKTIFLEKKGMTLDLGAIAKGYIADKIMDHLKTSHAIAALINLGGNVLVYGPNTNRPDQKWYIGIQNPELERGQNVGILKISDQSVVTSGIYERKMVYKGKTYHHIFDPNTGYPTKTDMASLTIVSDLSVDCEIWTTKLFGLPILEAMAIINETSGIEGIIITQDHRITISNGLTNDFQLLY